ncbi:hypothetical protein [Pimelobacter simplex]|uniref:hypothetical protein n=1 Tax=Nocardioides simplex TaxID=2045 RepID=UPI003AAAE5D1
MDLRAAGEFRRTPLERADQDVSWARGDQAFFASGACHLLAWTVRAAHPGHALAVVGLRRPGEAAICHVYAVRADGWAFDHAGWHPEVDLRAVNEAYEGTVLERVPVPEATTLAAFCAAHRHRMPTQYAGDPWPRARAYVDRYPPPAT